MAKLESISRSIEFMDFLLFQLICSNNISYDLSKSCREYEKSCIMQELSFIASEIWI